MLPSIQQLDQQLAHLPDPQERLSWLTQRARRVAPLPETERHPSQLVPGCQSRVWLQRQLDAENRLQLQAAADSPLVYALVTTLIQIAQNQHPADLPADLPEPLAQHGILTQLTPTRLQGLTQVWQTIRQG